MFLHCGVGIILAILARKFHIPYIELLVQDTTDFRCKSSYGTLVAKIMLNSINIASEINLNSLNLSKHI